LITTLQRKDKVKAREEQKMNPTARTTSNSIDAATNQTLTDRRTMKTPMKAIVRDQYGSAKSLKLRELEVPQINDDQVLVEVRAAGLDRGAWHLMTGRPYLIRVAGYGFLKPKNPVLGMDLAGVVQAVGKNVTGLRAGDRVFGIGNGAFAQYASARADKLALMPTNASFEQAAVIPVSALTALQALRDQGHVQAGQRVLIVGASGGVGSFAVQIAKAFGATVTGVCSTAKQNLVQSLGADEVIDYTRSDFTKSKQRYDLIIDIGGNRPLSQLRRVLTETGTLVIVGAEGGNQFFGAMGRVLQAMMLKSLTRQRLVTFICNENNKDLETLAKMIEQGTVKPVIDRICPLIALPEAMRDLEAGRVRGKVAVAVSA
jgi:NADPH:quinone reductase-like Zn-dependent oxidoreductase